MIYEGHEGLFCETPYQLTEYISQPISGLLHVPFIPLMIIWYHCTCCKEFITKRNKNQILLLVIWQIFCQLFTTMGHFNHNNQGFIRFWSSTFVLIFIEGFLQLSTTDKLQNWRLHISVLICYQILPFFGFVIAGPIILFIYCKHYRLLNKIPRNDLIIISMLLSMSFGALHLENNYCQIFLNIYDFPYHAVFDLLFWCVLVPYLDFVMLKYL